MKNTKGMNMKKIVSLSLAVSAAMFLTACGGGDGSTEKMDNQDKDLNTLSVKGKLVDGYIKNAKVFFDIDGDGIQSANEPYDMTNDKGEFSISLKDVKKIEMGSGFVAKGGGTDTDIDETISTDFAVSVPHGISIENLAKEHIYITPLSTILTNFANEMVKNNMSLNGLNMGNFQDTILKTLKLSKDDLKKDPLAGQDTKLWVTNFSIQKAVELTGGDYKDFVKIFKSDSKSLQEAISASDLTNKDKAANFVSIIEKRASQITPENRKEMAQHIQSHINHEGEDPHSDTPQPKPEAKPLKPANDQANLAGDVAKKVLAGRVVIDRYINNVSVFQELKKGGVRNFKLDSNEPSTKTDEFGRFKFEVESVIGMGLLYMVNENGLAFSPGIKPLKNHVYITPSTTVLAKGAFLAIAGDLGGLNMMNFYDNLLKSMNLTEEDLAKNPLDNFKIYKINQFIHYSVKIAGISYDDFIKILPNKTSIKQAVKDSSLTNKDKIIKLIEFYESLSDEDLKNHGISIADNVKKAIEDGNYNFTKE